MSATDQTTTPPVHVTLAEPLPVAVVRPGPTVPRLVAEVFTAALLVAFRAWFVLLVLAHFDLHQFGYLEAVLVVVAVDALRGFNLDYLSWTHTLGRQR